jgi:eukaryotic-like serine/threonine-protein kinase
MSNEGLVGKKFGDYEILEELGAGGMGRVYRARDLTLDRVVGLKTLADQFSSDAAFVQRFLKEARSAARLNHPNIVQIYNFGQVDSVYYLAMEFVDGRSLGYYLRKHGPFSEAEGLNLVRQACVALSVAHGEGIVHRDVKPDNLMLNKKGQLKLVDLGVAKILDDAQGQTLTGQSMGTPHYISPEQIRGQKDIDGRADIYSLGAAFYHLVTGHTPFEGTSGPVVMSRHLTDPLPDPRQWKPDLSRGLCHVIRKSMAKDREERYKDVYALDMDLYLVQTGQPPKGEEPSSTAVQQMAEIEGLSTLAPRTPQVAFDSGVLHVIEDRLALAIGPLAKVLVRKAAKTAPSLDALCQNLAGQIASEASRAAFLQACREPVVPTGAAASSPGQTPRSFTGPASSETRAAPVAPAPASTTGPKPAVWDEAFLQRAESELARRIGPLARILVKKAAKTATSAEQLASALAEHVPDEEERKSFREAVRKLAG